MTTTKVWSEREGKMVDVPVVWSGANRRQYLTMTSDVSEPVEREERRREPRVQDRVTDAWLAGEHYRETDSARMRMHYSIRCANAPFTVAELAVAADVSRTLVRRFLDESVAKGECRLKGRRPTARTFADLYVFVPATTVLVVPAAVEGVVEVNSN